MVGVIAAGLLAAGCAQQVGGRPSAARTCAQAAIRALEHHITLTRRPAACEGLTAAQLRYAANAATAAAVDAGTLRGKTLMRDRRRELGPLLPHLAPQQPQPSQPPSAGPGRATAPPYGLAALATWLVTVGLGLWMMTRWITLTGLRRALRGARGGRPAMNAAHLALAVAGLVVWACYLATGLAALAWLSCAMLLPVTGLGMSLVFLRVPARSLAPATAFAVAGGRPAREQAPGTSSPAGKAAVRSLTPVLAAHVALAMATMLFALMAAVGA